MYTNNNIKLFNYYSKARKVAGPDTVKSGTGFD
jgi:hypothetical protein